MFGKIALLFTRCTPTQPPRTAGVYLPIGAWDDGGPGAAV